MITKRSSYSPPQRIGVSPAKKWKDMSVNSYDVNGRSSNWQTMDPHQETHPVVDLKDHGDEDEP
jgi:hypothetical protein